MYIYRIEHKEDKRGMFNSRHSYKVEDTIRITQFPYPINCPYDDPKIKRGIIKRKEFCAFKSLKDVKKYISRKDYDLLTSKGFKLLRIRIDKCVIGKEQVLYQRKNILSCKDITNTIKY